jgi:hypothetical protein
MGLRWARFGCIRYMLRLPADLHGMAANPVLTWWFVQCRYMRLETRRLLGGNGLGGV